MTTETTGRKIILGWLDGHRLRNPKRGTTEACRIRIKGGGLVDPADRSTLSPTDETEDWPGLGRVRIWIGSWGRQYLVDERVAEDRTDAGVEYLGVPADAIRSDDIEEEHQS